MREKERESEHFKRTQTLTHTHTETRTQKEGKQMSTEERTFRKSDSIDLNAVFYHLISLKSNLNKVLSIILLRTFSKKKMINYNERKIDGVSSV